MTIHMFVKRMTIHMFVKRMIATTLIYVIVHSRSEMCMIKFIHQLPTLQQQQRHASTLHAETTPQTL